MRMCSYFERSWTITKDGFAGTTTDSSPAISSSPPAKDTTLKNTPLSEEDMDLLMAEAEAAQQQAEIS